MQHEDKKELSTPEIQILDAQTLANLIEHTQPDTTRINACEAAKMLRVTEHTLNKTLKANGISLVE